MPTSKISLENDNVSKFHQRKMSESSYDSKGQRRLKSNSRLKEPTPIAHSPPISPGRTR